MKGVDLERAMRAEAAAWLARLRSDERTAADETGFRAWLEDDVRHRQAFDLVNTAWELAGGELAELTKPTPFSALPGEGKRGRARGTVVVVAAIVITSFVIAGSWWGISRAHWRSFATEIGEQRRIALADGSIMMLDTASHAVVSFRPDRRQVNLLRGRAHFEVNKDTRRPFIVDMGDRQLVTVGTTFDVMRTPDVQSVVLSGGQAELETSVGEPRALVAGDRVIIQRGGVLEDKPNLKVLTAWQTGQMIFDHAKLGTVVAELNRYSKCPIVIEDEAIAAIVISGTFKLGDNKSFARSMADAYPIDLRNADDKIYFGRR